VVEEQKGRKLGMALVVEDGMHREAIAHPVTLGLLVDAEDVFHASNMGLFARGIKGYQGNR
jgi:hypothetical protein